MDLQLSIQTIQILAWSKLIFFGSAICLLYFIFKIKKPLAYLLLTTISLVAFYIVLAWPLVRMWWGNVGDELLVAGYLGKVLFDGPMHDFYYGWLPNFYPPLYFWVTGLISRPFAHNAIVAAKVGIAGVMLLLFLGTYFWQKFFWSKINNIKLDKNDIVSSPWFWWLLPLGYLAMLNFDALMLKPYEILAALCSAILIGLMSRSFYAKAWGLKHYVFFGLSGGILFLTFYFWWVLIIPLLFYLVLATGAHKKINFKRLVYAGLIMAAVSSIFWGPLFYSYIKYGLENGQATHFVPYDFYTFVPWQTFSWQAVLYAVGIFGLVRFRKKSFVKSSLYLFVACYIYQLVNLIYFVAGGRPVQSSKPLLFLGSAAVAVGLAYIFIYIYQKYISRFKPVSRQAVFIVGAIVLMMRMPFVYFIDDQVILSQIEKDLIKPQATIELAEAIKENVPDYKERIWLSSGSSELSIYLPLSYYIANSQHFSHHASLYSERMSVVSAMARAADSEGFMAIINQTEPKVDSLLLYHNADTDKEGYYTLFFWHDNFPNGGKDVQVYLSQDLIVVDDWQEVYNNNNWEIFLRK